MAKETKETMERAVRVRVHSVQYDYRESLSERIAQIADAAEKLSDENAEETEEALFDESCCGESGEPFEMVTEGRLRIRGNLCELSYMEDRAEGMDDVRSTLVFSKARPNILTLTRSGMMQMTLSFEEGRHHIGSYHIGALQAFFSEDQKGLPIASYARKVQNNLLGDGTLELDYIIEVRGMDTQRTVFSISLSDLPLAPVGLGTSVTEHSPTEEGDIQ